MKTGDERMAKRGRSQTRSFLSDSLWFLRGQCPDDAERSNLKKENTIKKFFNFIIVIFLCGTMIECLFCKYVLCVLLLQHHITSKVKKKMNPLKS